VRIGAHVSIAGGLNRVWDRARGHEAIQIFTQSGRGWTARPRDPGEVSEFAAEARRRRVPVLVHASYLINLASGDPALAARSEAAFLDEVERCEALGVRHLVFHPGAHTGDGATVGRERVTAALRRILTATAGYRVRLLIELTAGQGSCLGGSFGEVAALLDALDARRRTGVCFDTCHAYAGGYDLRRRYDAVWRDFQAQIGLGRLFAFHLNDSRRELGSRVDRHAAIGAGHLGGAVFRRLVRDPRFAGLPSVMELPPAETAAGLALLHGWRTTPAVRA
jgi:deoxyribonuclease-4